MIRIDEIDLQILSVRHLHVEPCWRCPRARRSQDRALCNQCLCVGLNVLHDDEDLSIWALRDGVPEGQAVRRKMETVGTWQRVSLGKRVGKSWDWFPEQVED